MSDTQEYLKQTLEQIELEELELEVIYITALVVNDSHLPAMLRVQAD